MRNLVPILLIATISFSCKPRETNVITFAVGGAPSEVEFWEKIVEEFERESNIKVKILRQPTDTDLRRQGLVVPLSARKKDPDVFLMDIVWIPQFAASGYLENLSNLVKIDNFDIQNFFKYYEYKGIIYAFPVYIDGGLLYYRKDLLAKYRLAVPKTWEELAKTAIRIQEEEKKRNRDFYGFVFQGAQYEGLICTFVEFALSNNGSIALDSINTKENVEALKFMRDLIHAYFISPPNTYTEMKEEEVKIFFQQGNALFERNWPYAYALHQSEDSKIKGKVGIAPLPSFQGGRSVATEGDGT